MKILSITAQKPNSTGSGVYLTELVKSFARDGHEQAAVYGITAEDTAEFPEGVKTFPVIFDSMKDGGVPYHVVGMSDMMPYTATRYADLTGEMIEQFEKAFINAVGRAVGETKPDIIICHHLYLLTSLVRKHFPNERIYGISHGTDLRQFKNLNNCNSPYTEECGLRAIRDDIRENIAALDGAFALHSEQSKEICELFDLPESKVSVIGSGYDDTLFYPKSSARSDKSDEPVRIFYAGKLSREKGVIEMIHALNGMAHDDSQEPETAFRLELAGGCQDPKAKALFSLGEDDELKPGVLKEKPYEIVYHGILDRESMAEMMRSVDVFILPSYFEGMPLVIIEALASGAVTVCTDLPGIREYLDEVIPNNDVIYIPLPRMETIDRPEESAIPEYEESIRTAVRTAIERVNEHRETEGDFAKTPGVDASGATWQALSRRILRLAAN